MTGSSFLTGIQTLLDGSMILAGQNSGTLTLGEGDSATEIVGGKGSHGRRTWLARFDPDGELIWASPIAGNHIGSITITSDDSIIVTGMIAAHEVSGNDPEISRIFGAGTPGQPEVAGCEPVFERYRRETSEETWDPERWGPQSRGEPSCSIRFVARYDSDGNFQWVRTGHSQYRGARPLAVALPDGSVIARLAFGGVALLDAGTPSERFLPLPFKYYMQNVPFLVRYQPDGSIDWVEQLGADDEMLKVWPFPVDDDSVALVGWSGFSLDTTDRDKYMDAPPAYSLAERRVPATLQASIHAPRRHLTSALVAEPTSVISAPTRAQSMQMPPTA